ncbi:MAG: bifunctional phosphopantothenoylcysteine decarboxylase/phosphopantothenate--cysteine ligase CoaBC [Candidatus Nanopelagicales bacterium]|nr:bifunctional phosphopantothenoylcysteine decarboxylase/phosphopantothenate--cysteine ligase CoaBC [Candidatus Nanopelagicales bacterium]MCU0299314.1 bifunctional phosphopantothenoylcysteine decarboxylase/phosphopantothenate--cysteine ligase CoaBC [Candidatus Nanopelagicales bacterium]
MRRIQALDAKVTVVPTKTALEFVGAATWSALSGRPVTSDFFDNVHEVPHVRIGQQADLVVVAPATANLLAKASYGLADDLLTNTLLTAHCPVVMFPAMHTEMWEHPATRANVATLRDRGVLVVDPDSGRLTGYDSGPGRLPEPEAIAWIVQAALAKTGLSPDLRHRHVVISGGGTRERLDPVRHIGNRSSGKQAMSLAAAAVSRGARVTLIRGDVDVPTPAGVEVIDALTADDMLAAAQGLAPAADAIIMAAAIADFRAETLPDSKIKKSDSSTLTLNLVHNPDVLATLVAQRSGRTPLLVGFAAETGDEAGTWLEHAERKFAKKGCDIMVANPVGHDRAFGADHNEAVLLLGGGISEEIPGTCKVALSHRVLDAVVDRLV